MRTIEVYHHIGSDRQLISRMWFLKEKDLDDMSRQILSLGAFNSLRRDRHEVCEVRFIYPSGFETEYYTDGLPGKILNICTEYALFYAQARKLAQSRAWQFAWQYASQKWRHKAILRQMSRASKLLKTPPLGLHTVLT